MSDAYNENVWVFGSAFGSTGGGAVGGTGSTSGVFNPLSNPAFQSWYSNYIKSSSVPLIDQISKYWNQFVTWWKANVHISLSPNALELAIAGVSYKQSLRGSGSKKPNFSGTFNPFDLVGVIGVVAIFILMLWVILR